MDPAIQKLIEKAVAARDAARKAIPRARGAGTYKVTITEKDQTVSYKERSEFRMAFNRPDHFIQFRYKPGAGYEDPDVYARVVLSQDKAICESRFCQRIAGGAEAQITEAVENGSLAPVAWMSGDLFGYYSSIENLLKNKRLRLSLQDKNGLKVVTGRNAKKTYAIEFSIDPQNGDHIVRYRLWNFTGKKPFASTDVTREWKKTGKLWYVKRCFYGAKSHMDGIVHQTEEIELVLDTFEPNVEIPKEVFTVHALGLPEGVRILPNDPNDPDEPIERYQPDPKFDVSKVERVVGKLPKVKPKTNP